MEKNYMLKIGSRLRALRDSHGWSQSKMAKELYYIIKTNPELKDVDINEDNERQTVSSLENASRGLTVDFAIAYSRVFQVSLDYIFCLSDVQRPENKDIIETTGLSNKAIENLEKYKNYDGTDNQIFYIDLANGTDYVEDFTKHTRTLNTLIENENESSIILNIAKYLFCSFENLAPVNKNTGHTELIYGDDMNTMFLLKVQNQLHDLKKTLDKNI